MTIERWLMVNVLGTGFVVGAVVGLLVTVPVLADLRAQLSAKGGWRWQQTQYARRIVLLLKRGCQETANGGPSRGPR